jgi:hypothetical protein
MGNAELNKASKSEMAYIMAMMYSKPVRNPIPICVAMAIGTFLAGSGISSAI